jgi:hypothetical protein
MNQRGSRKKIIDIGYNKIIVPSGMGKINCRKKNKTAKIAWSAQNLQRR